MDPKRAIVELRVAQSLARSPRSRSPFWREDGTTTGPVALLIILLEQRAEFACWWRTSSYLHFQWRMCKRNGSSPGAGVHMSERTFDAASATEYEALLALSPAVLNAIPGALVLCDPQGRLVRCNDEAKLLWGIVSDQQEPADLFKDHQIFGRDGVIPVDNPITAVLAAARPARNSELLVVRPDGSRFTALMNIRSLLGRQAEVQGVIVCCQDVSLVKDLRAEFTGHSVALTCEASVGGHGRLHLQRLAAIVEFSDDAIISKDVNGIIQTWNRGAERIFGYTAEEVIGRPVNILIPADRQDEEPSILARIRRGDSVDHYETVRRRKDGSFLDISLTVSPLKNAQGHVIGASKIARDISERRRQEERREVMTHELNHRVKNTLATVQSLAAQTFRKSSRDPEYRRFEGRLVSLAQAHDLLSRHEWAGVSLRQLFERMVHPIVTDRTVQIEADGPAFQLLPKAALSLAMAFHELCTNALKYGALSTDQGRIKLRWRVTTIDTQQLFHLRWHETEGPVVQAPEKRGFGSVLLERVVKGELDARTDLSFPPDGAVYDLCAPVGAVLQGS